MFLFAVTKAWICLRIDSPFSINLRLLFQRTAFATCMLDFLYVWHDHFDKWILFHFLHCECTFLLINAVFIHNLRPEPIIDWRKHKLKWLLLKEVQEIILTDKFISFFNFWSNIIYLSWSPYEIWISIFNLGKIVRIIYIVMLSGINVPQNDNDSR